MEKIVDIIESIAYEKGLSIDGVESAVKEAMLKVAKNAFSPELHYDCEIDKKEKELRLYQVVFVCDDSELNALEEKGENKNNYIILSEAKKHDNDIKVGDELRYEVDLEQMNRSALNSLFRELEYGIQQLQEQQIFDKYKAQVGKIISGVVVRVDENGNTIVELDEVRATLGRKNRIKGEFFSRGQNISAVLKHISADRKSGINIELSRTSPKMLEALLELEVPEIKDGEVEIISCARIPGERAKVALRSKSPKIDPVGAAVGVKGVRINAVGRELKNESIDCIEYSDRPEIYIARALAPALVISVKIESAPSFGALESLKDKDSIESGKKDSIESSEKSEKIGQKEPKELKEEAPRPKAIVSITSEQKPKAIGKNGVNIRLASMLSGYEIELKEIASSASVLGANAPLFEVSAKNSTDIESNVDLAKGIESKNTESSGKNEQKPSGDLSVLSSLFKD